MLEIKQMFQDCRYRSTNEIKIETKNKIENKWKTKAKRIYNETDIREEENTRKKSRRAKRQ